MLYCTVRDFNEEPGGIMILQLICVAIGLSWGATKDFEDSNRSKVLDKIHLGLATLFAISASVANAQQHHEPNYEVVSSYHLPSLGDYLIEFLKFLPFFLAGFVAGFGIKFLWRKLHTEASSKDQQDKEKRNVSDIRQSPVRDVKPQVDGIQTTSRGPVDTSQTSKRTTAFTEGGIKVTRHPDGTYSSGAKPPSAPRS